MDSNFPKMKVGATERKGYREGMANYRGLPRTADDATPEEAFLDTEAALLCDGLRAVAEYFSTWNGPGTDVLRAFQGAFPPRGEAPTARELLLELAVVDALLDNPAFSQLHFAWKKALPPGYAPLLVPLDAPTPEAPLGVRALLRPPPSAGTSARAQLVWFSERFLHLAETPLFRRFFARLTEVREKQADAARRYAPPPGPGPVELPAFSEEATYDHAPEVNYTQDREWMPEVVVLAKAVYVWFDQLSRRYGRPIETLRDLPQEELIALRDRGITCLWLIGLWERSPASLRIKERAQGGHDDAVGASAYALVRYEVASRLGGDDALWDLKNRAQALGIRLCGDVVPNHTGIDSDWVKDHPDWFLHTLRPPYPNYRFTGQNLGDEQTQIRLEDGYADRSDAAVVFEHVEKQTGKIRYIYHGNDGTSTPWNDTAQLDILNPAAREALLSLIVSVAKRFPVIRFDAAMTLAKQHVRRLWHPRFGDAGGVPSRGEHPMSEARFHELLPREFWREVVDRIAKEAPDTLLLAEAFWMMEGYFVRTLGMHRVYNSAFMHMLKQEDNGGYRAFLKEILATAPETLGRFVHFMSNPDEEPAAEQFGTFEKYFGVCTLVATLPGLPLFGHGQFEGFREKYGMEYLRARRDEPIDQGLLGEHERVIFPLIRERSRFAGVTNFRLYDFLLDDESVDPDVYAFSQIAPDGRGSIIFYRNTAKPAVTGRIHLSAPFLRNGELASETVGTALGVSGAAPLLFRDPMRGRSVEVTGDELRFEGFPVTLGPYETVAFTVMEVAPAKPETRESPAQAADTLKAPLPLPVEPESVAPSRAPQSENPPESDVDDSTAMTSVAIDEDAP